MEENNNRENVIDAEFEEVKLLFTATAAAAATVRIIIRNRVTAAQPLRRWCWALQVW